MTSRDNAGSTKNTLRRANSSSRLLVPSAAARGRGSDGPTREARRKPSRPATGPRRVRNVRRSAARRFRRVPALRLAEVLRVYDEARAGRERAEGGEAVSELVKRRCSCRHHASGSEDCLACCVGVAQAQRDRAEAELTEARAALDDVAAALDDVAAALGFDGEELPPGRVAAGLLSRIRGDEEAAAKRMIENGRLRAALEAPTPAAYQRDLEQEVARLRAALEAERERCRGALADTAQWAERERCRGALADTAQWTGEWAASPASHLRTVLASAIAGCEEALTNQESPAATHRWTEAAHEERQGRVSAGPPKAAGAFCEPSVAGASPEAGRAPCYADFGFEGMLMERAAEALQPKEVMRPDAGDVHVPEPVSVASPAAEPPASAGECETSGHEPHRGRPCQRNPERHTT